MNSAHLLSLDPSMTGFGWCVVDLAPSGGPPRPLAFAAPPALLAAGVLETRPTPKNKRPSVAEDEARRVRFLRRELVAVCREWRPSLVVIEAIGAVKGAKTVKSMAEAATVAALVADECIGAAPIYFSPQAIEGALGLTPTERRTKGAPAKTADESDAARKARKLRLAKAAIAGFGAQNWADAFSLGAVISAEDEAFLYARRWEGALDAGAQALASLSHPMVAAVRSMARGVGAGESMGAA